MTKITNTDAAVSVNLILVVRYVDRDEHAAPVYKAQQITCGMKLKINVNICLTTFMSVSSRLAVPGPPSDRRKDKRSSKSR